MARKKTTTASEGDARHAAEAPPAQTVAPAGVESPARTCTPSVHYVVLARKYRPTTFDDLIGQDAMVRTL
jgi:DNA polymerase-3 subunit gamma/tau